MFRYISAMDGWIPGKFGMEMANAILFISYLDKICLTLTGSLGRASAFLYSEVRLYKGARPAFPPSVDGHTFCRQHLRVDRESTTATHVEQ